MGQTASVTRGNDGGARVTPIASNSVSASASACPVKNPTETVAATTTSTTTTTTDTKATEGGCPWKPGSGRWGMKNPHVGGTTKPNTTATQSTSGSSSACPVQNQTKSSQPQSQPQQQQYNVYSQPIDGTNNMPSVANQMPAPGQKESLSTERERSTIPKGGTDGDTWVYPSPQMFYNALVRKNKLGDTTEEDISSVVAIHNNMNERTWRKVLQWEAVLAGDDSSKQTKLSRFLGRPSDLSPKAWIKHYVLGHPLPFDRHDWTVLRQDGTEVRYVIDYYHDDEKASEDPDSAFPSLGDTEAVRSIAVDVRPANDSFSAVVGRLWHMPLAVHVYRNTPIRYLPWWPDTSSPSFSKSVEDSRRTWADIQRDVASTRAAGGNPSSPSVREEPTVQNNDGELTLTHDEAVSVAKSFATMMRECADARRKLDAVEDDESAAKASLDLSMCMAKIVCPLQYQSLQTVLTKIGASDDDDDGHVDVALNNMVTCVTNQNKGMAQAKQQFPDLFPQSAA